MRFARICLNRTQINSKTQLQKTVLIEKQRKTTKKTKHRT